jgi:multiple sugar transport system permease protein
MMALTDASTTALPASRGRRREPSRRPRISLRQRENIGYALFVAVPLLYVVYFFGYPLLKNVWMGFVNFRTATFVTGEAPWVGLDNYVAVFQSPIFPIALANTIFITVATVSIQLVIGLALGAFFNQRFPGSAIISGAFLLPWLIPMVATAGVWKWMLAEGGPLSEILISLGQPGAPLADPRAALAWLVVVNIWLGIPFFVVILSAALKGVPADQLEAAQLDGAGRFGRFWHIVLPTIRPQVTVAATLSVIYTLKILELPLVLTGGGPANATQTLGTLAYSFSFTQFQFGQGAAVSNILMVVTLAFAVVYVVLGYRKEENA